MSDVLILRGSCLRTLGELDEGSVRCCVTSPPYWGLRSYLPDGHPDKAHEVGTEATPELYVERLVDVFREVRRLLTDDGTLWLNLGDTYVSRKGNPHPQGPESDGYTRRNRNARRRAPKPDGLDYKNLVGIPWRVALALQADGWFLRSDVIWAKPNPTPQSVIDRPTSAHEYVFLLSKSGTPLFWTHPTRGTVRKHPDPDYVWRHNKTGEIVTTDPEDADNWRRRNLWRGHDYFYDIDAIREPHTMRPQRRPTGRSTDDPVSRPGHPPQAWSNSVRAEPAPDGHPLGRNKRSVWTVPTQPYPGAHFAVMPPRLAEPCILAGSAMGDTVLDPFAGAGTVAIVALQHGRKFVGCELVPEFVELAEARIQGATSQRQLFTPVGKVAP